MAAEGTRHRSETIVPRASDLNRLEIVVELGALGIMAPEEIGKRLNVAPSKAEYLIELGQWFGFVDATCSDLTERGRRFVGQVGRRRAIVREVLWGRPLVRQVFDHPDWADDPDAAAEAVVADRTDLSPSSRRQRARSFVRLLERISLRKDQDVRRDQEVSLELPSPGSLPVEVLGLSDDERAWARDRDVATVDGFVEAETGALAEAGDDGRLAQLHRRARAIAECDVSAFESVARRLVTERWSMEADWQDVLVDVPTRAESGFDKAGFETIGQLVVAVGCSDLTRLPGIGQNTADVVGDQLSLIADQGYDVYLYGPGGRPRTVTELADRMLNSLGEDDRELMRLRFLEGKTFSEIGEIFGLTRQRMRQKTGDYLERLRGHYQGVARGLIGMLLQRMEAGAGLVHRSQVELWTGCSDLYRVLLVALLLDEGTYIWNDHFLANRASTRLQRGPVAEVRRRIADADRMQVPLREVVAFAREAGIGIDPEGARDLVEVVWGLDCDRRGRVHNPWTNKGDRIAQVLVEARRPLELDAIAERYAEAHASEEEAKPTARRVQPFVKKHPKVYTVGNGRYVHEVALPLNKRVLDDVADWCIERLKGQATAVSVKVLLEELQESEFAVGDHIESLNWYLLRDVLLRHSGVIGFHNTFNVAWEASYQEAGVTLLDRVERILAEAGGPVSSEEVLDRLPEDFEVNPHSVENYLVAEPFSIRMGDDIYLHRDNLGLAEGTRRRVVETAVDLLPDDGTVIGTPQLVEWMADREATREFAERDRAAEEIWGLLRHDDRAQTSPELLAARPVGEGGELLKRAITEVLREQGPAYPREVDEALEERFGFQVSDSRVYRRMRELAAESELARLSNGLYYQRMADDTDLFAAFEKRSRELIRLARRANLTDFDSDELFMLARYFDHTDRPSAARNVLEVLLDRGGDPEVFETWKRLYQTVVDELERDAGE